MLNELERLTNTLAGRYRVDRELGRGGMATVYLAHDLRHDRPVALKVLRPELAHSLGPERFLREIKVTARLDHPGILPLLDSGSADGVLFYVMPYVEGESLRDRLNREKQLPVGDALQIAREVADALGYAHSRGLVHRDIKPENILLSASHARIADFGIARAVTAAGGEKLTETGLAVGTAAYMSPEQAAGGTDVDGRSDLYSLGCVIYEMFAGDPPFTGTNPQALLTRKSLETARPLRPVRPAVPPQVEEAVLVALAPVPADRFATAAEFIERLDRAGHTAGTVVPNRSSFPVRLLASVAFVAFAAVLGIWSKPWWEESGTGPEVLATRVAVFPFLVEDPQLAHLSEGLMDLVSNAVDGAGEIRRVDPYVLMSRLRVIEDSESQDLGVVSRIARDLGAGRFLLGRVVSSGQSVQLLASLYAGVDPSGPEHQFVHEGPADSISALIGALARDLLMNVPTGPGTWAVQGSEAATTSFAALREYSRGEVLMRRSEPRAAAAAFRNALVADSTFALAWLRLAFAEDYRYQDSSMVAAIDRAMHFHKRLSPRDRMLAETIHANYHGDGFAAERAALALVSAYPGYGEGWFQLGASQFWYAWQRGRSPLFARAALERALAVDTDHRQALHTLSWLEYLDGRAAQAESLRTRAWGELAPSPPADPSQLPDYMEDVASWNTARLIFLVYSTAWRTDRLSDASRIAALLGDTARRSQEVLSAGHLLRGQVEVAAGRWNAANSAFGEANLAAPGAGVIERAWLAALPFLRVSEDARRLLRDSLAGWTAPATLFGQPGSRKNGPFPFMGLLLTPPWLVPHARHYVLGLLSAGLEEEAEAQRYAVLLRSASEPADSIGLLRDLSLEIQALLSIQKGDTAAALAILDSVEFRIASHYQVFESLFHTRPVTRWIRAEALATSGRYREALGHFAALPWLNAFFLYLAWSSLRQGELYERLGDPASAVYHYGRFVERWENADSIHQPLVTDVRRRIQRLSEGSEGRW